MIKRNLRLLAILGLITMGTSLYPTQIIFAETTENSVNKEEKSDDEGDLAWIAGSLFESVNIKVNSTYKYAKNKDNVYTLVSEDGVTKEVNDIKGQMNDIDKKKNTLKNEYAIDDNNKNIVMYTEAQDRLYQSLVLIAKYSFESIKDHGASEKINSAINSAKEIKQYIANERKLEKSEYVKEIDAQLASFNNELIGIYEKDAVSTIESSINENNTEKLIDGIKSAKNIRRKLRNTYKLVKNDAVIKKINKEIKKGEKNVVIVRASEAVGIIDNAIAATDLNILKEGKEKASAIRVELVEKYRQATSSIDVVRVDSAISRIDEKINSINKQEPIVDLDKAIEEATNNKDCEKLKNLVLEGKKLIGNTTDKDTISKLNKSIETSAINLANIIYNKILNVDSNQQTKYKDIYNLFNEFKDFKKFINENTELSNNKGYTNMLENIQKTLASNFNKGNAASIMDTLLNKATATNNYEESEDILNVCKGLRTVLVDNYNESYESSELMAITDKIVNAEQQLKSKRYENDEVIELVSNPNWVFRGLPEEINVREKKAKLDSVSVDIIANENMKIEGDKVIFIDQSNAKENFWKTVTVYNEFAKEDKWFEGCQYKGPDGKVVNSIGELADREVKTGEVLFSIIIPTRVDVVNRTYWQRLDSTKNQGSNDEVTLSATLKADKADSVKTSLSKILRIDEGFTGGGSMSQQGVTATASASVLISKSFQETFERGISITEGFSKTIQHKFSGAKADSSIGLYQMVEEVQMYNSEPLLNTVNNRLKNLNVTAKIETKATVNTTRFTPVIVNKDDTMIKQ